VSVGFHLIEIPYRVSVRFLHIIFRYVAAAEKHSYYGLQINLLKNSPGLTFSVLQSLNDHHTS
jgi:hypothetical protein